MWFLFSSDSHLLFGASCFVERDKRIQQIQITKNLVRFPLALFHHPLKTPSTLLFLSFFLSFFPSPSLILFPTSFNDPKIQQNKPRPKRKLSRKNIETKIKKNHRNPGVVKNDITESRINRKTGIGGTRPSRVTVQDVIPCLLS